MSTYFDLTIQRSEDVDVTDVTRIGWRVKVSVSDVGPVDQDKAIFVYKKLGSGRSVFSHVASVVDMETFGRAAPEDGESFFRLEAVDLILDTEALRDQVVDVIEQDVKDLATAIDNTNSLPDLTVTRVPSNQTETNPSGVLQGSGTTTIRVNFPVALDNPSPKVFINVTPSASVKVTSDANGFDIASTRTLTSSDVIRWAVLDV